MLFDGADLQTAFDDGLCMAGTDTDFTGWNIVLFVNYEVG